MNCEDIAAFSNNLNGCHAVSVRVASCRQQKWTLNSLSRKEKCGVADKINGKAGEPALENRQERGRFSSRWFTIPSQIIPQNQSSEWTLLLPHWTHDLVACTSITVALKPGYHWRSATQLPRNTTPQALLPLLAAIVHCLLSIFL